ncbi:MAG: hypothetical protein IBX44_00055 [Sulfurospirillum sp.]|nr:hypothetical protein [Sulfurospirillum sp.]
MTKKEEIDHLESVYKFLKIAIKLKSVLNLVFSQFHHIQTLITSCYNLENFQDNKNILLLSKGK